jgi:hypothetical protein
LATRTGYREGEKAGDKNNIKAIHKFTTPMPYQGEVLDVVMTVREFYRKESFGGTHQLYTLESLELGTPASLGDAVIGAGLVSQSRPHAPAGVTDRLGQMRAIVKGELRPEDAADIAPPVFFSRSSPAVASPAASSRLPSIAPFRARMDKVIDSLIYNFQDRFKPLKDIQKRAGIVPEAEDAALAEERYSGTVRARTDDFEASMREPLIKVIHESKVEYDDVEEYLHALHAPSRNAAMREINSNEAELSWTDKLTANRDALANYANVDEYLVGARTAPGQDSGNSTLCYSSISRLSPMPTRFAGVLRYSSKYC